jgi:FMN phosphatase YigB (HAD superfamily)
MKKTKVYVFDFDGTLMQSPEPEEGKAMYERQFGQAYPHKGWWSKRESLHQEFDIKPNEAVLAHYREAVAAEAQMIMMTNRLAKLEDLLQFHLDKHGVKFDNKSFGDTEKGRQTKPQRLSYFLEELRGKGFHPVDIIVLDDMEDQIQHYLTMREDWRAWGSPMTVRILQVMPNGTITER